MGIPAELRNEALYVFRLFLLLQASVRVCCRKTGDGFGGSADCMEIYHPREDELLREMRRVRREGRRKRLLWGTLIILVLSALFGWLVLTRWFTLAEMRGPDMGSTLPEGSLVLVQLLDNGDCARGDIVLFETDEGYQLKRVLATGGDQLVLNPYGETRVNGDLVETNHLIGRHTDAGVTARRLTIQNNEVFVQGDHLSLSIDSRHRNYGPIPKDRIIGRAAFVLWPVYRFGAPIQVSSETVTAPEADQAGPEASEPAPPEEPEAQTNTAAEEEG